MVNAQMVIDGSWSMVISQKVIAGAKGLHGGSCDEGPVDLPITLSVIGTIIQGIVKLLVSKLLQSNTIPYTWYISRDNYFNFKNFTLTKSALQKIFTLF